jgi:hypothetical protein
MKYQLTNEEQARSLMVTLWPKVLTALNAGKELVLEVKAADKTREQELKYHAMIDEIAKQAKHMGASWDAESWKRLLVDLFCKYSGLQTGVVMPNLSGDGIVQLGYQTRKFTKEQASDFVEFLYAWGAEHGIVYSQV